MLDHAFHILFDFLKDDTCTCQVLSNKRWFVGKHGNTFCALHFSMPVQYLWNKTITVYSDVGFVSPTYCTIVITFYYTVKPIISQFHLELHHNWHLQTVCCISIMFVQCCINICIWSLLTPKCHSNFGRNINVLWPYLC